ncbi:hypothetical protein HT031_003072 [Scenedesmus sp. PABB004]|nr:hypothetical protein HT031_003072 [Scenedesmus sp. PABB004]
MLGHAANRLALAAAAAAARPPASLPLAATPQAPRAAWLGLLACLDAAHDCVRRAPFSSGPAAAAQHGAAGGGGGSSSGSGGGAAAAHVHDASCGHSSGAARAPLTFEEQESTCWSCHDRAHRGGLVCRSCERIQPVDSSLTYFELMGYPRPTFDVDPAALERRYKLLQWTLHPDRAAGKSDQERQYSAAQAALINQAYGVLRQPLARANYMLMLGGVSPEDSEAHTIEDPELLMEVMEAREEVEGEADQEALVRLHATNRARQAALCGELSAAFSAGEAERARQLVAQLSYWVRLEEAIAAKL